MVNSVRTFARGLVLLIAAAATPLASAQDWTTYYTVVHAKDFELDWGKFYRMAEAKTMAVRKELRHELDVPYGKDPKQRMDLYFPTAKVTRPAPTATPEPELEPARAGKGQGNRRVFLDHVRAGG